MVFGSVFKSRGLRVTDDNVAAGLNQFSNAAAMDGQVTLPKRRLAVDKNGFAAGSRTPPVWTAAT
jgi:hypothetical protein